MVLRAVIFVSGAGLLAFEMVGLRIAAIYFGSGAYVVGNVIAAFLAAMTVGYWLGGLIADRAPRPAVLGLFLLGGGLLMAVIPPVYGPLLERLAWGTAFDPRLSSLLGSAILFGVPSALLATASPFAIRLAARSLTGVGNISGQMFAISTAGSIAGLLITSWYLIPLLGLDMLLWVTAGAMLLVGLVCLALEPVYRRALTPAVAALILVIAGPALATTERGSESINIGEVIYQKDTQYHRISVYDWVGYRYLRFDRSLQSGMVKADPFKSAFAYTDYVFLAWTYKPDIKSVLMLGLGGATVAKQIHHFFPQAQIDIAEIDPDVVDVAKRFFSFKEDERMKVTVGDARQFLVRNADKKYDLIIQDAYFADALPFHLATQEFFEVVKGRLNPGGVFFNNIVSALKGERSKIFRSIYKTMQTVFGRVEVYPVFNQWYGDEARNNLEVLSINGTEALPAKETRLSRARQTAKTADLDILPQLADGLYADRIPTDDIPMLTDKYAPTDALIHLW